VFNPSSKVYDYTFVELKPNGENEVSIVVKTYFGNFLWYNCGHRIKFDLSLILYLLRT